MKHIIGIDLGTSAVKTVLFDENFRVIASADEEYPLYQPHAGWAEQDPSDWWTAVKKTLAAVLGACRRIDAVGITGQMHGLVMLDEKGNPLRRAIIWCDQRTSAECSEITRLVGEDNLMRVTASPARTGFTASKLLWVRNNQPELYRKCRHILLPKDYIRYRLTGAFASDLSDASGTQLLDIRGRCWSEEVTRALGIDQEWLAPLFESPEITGRVTLQAAEEIAAEAALVGLTREKVKNESKNVPSGKNIASAEDCAPAENDIDGVMPGKYEKESFNVQNFIKGAPVVAGAGDNAASAVGCGAVSDGDAFFTIGTSGVVYVHTDLPSVDPEGRVHTFCCAVPGKWHVMGVTQGAGLSLRWLRDSFFVNTSYAELDKMAAKIPAGSEGLMFLPYIMGERTPYPDPFARGAFVGISAIHTSAHFVRAVLEGVSFSLRDCLEVIREMNVEAKGMRAVGGGCKSALWNSITAGILGFSISGVRNRDCAALGAAALAAVGAGLYKSVPDACRAAVSCSDGIEPSDIEVYEKRYRVYRSAYGNMKDIMHALAQD